MNLEKELELFEEQLLEESGIKIETEVLDEHRSIDIGENEEVFRVLYKGGEGVQGFEETIRTDWSVEEQLVKTRNRVVADEKHRW